MLNPRVQVSLSPEVHARVSSLAKARGISKSALIAEIITDQSVMFDDIAELIRLGKGVDALSEVAKARLSFEAQEGENYVKHLAEKALYELQDLLQSFEHTLKDLRPGAELGALLGAQNPRSGGVLSTSQPPYINKGARNLSEGGQLGSSKGGKKGSDE